MDNENNKQIYELGIITISDETALEIPKILQNLQFTIKKQDDPKTINLAYKINKRLEGIFQSIYITTANPESITKLNNTLELNKEVLRFIIIKSEEDNPVKDAKPEKVKDQIDNKKESENSKSKTPTIPEENLSNEALERKLEEILN